jgi:hypothetical protein
MPGFGTKQVYYKAGHPFLAWTGVQGSLFGPADVIHWAEMRPRLSGNPLTLYDVQVI